MEEALLLHVEYHIVEEEPHIAAVDIVEDTIAEDTFGGGLVAVHCMEARREGVSRGQLVFQEAETDLR